MRKKRSANPVILKSREISYSLQIYWISAVLFGLLMPLYVLVALATFDLYDLAVGFFFLANFILAVRGIRDLGAFKKKFMASPNEYVNKAIRQPLLYRAVFWYLPK